MPLDKHAWCLPCQGPCSVVPGTQEPWFAPPVSLASPQDPAEGVPTLRSLPLPRLSPLACHCADTQRVMAPEGDPFFPGSSLSRGQEPYEGWHCPVLISVTSCLAHTAEAPTASLSPTIQSPHGTFPRPTLIMPLP